MTLELMPGLSEVVTRGSREEAVYDDHVPHQECGKNLVTALTTEASGRYGVVPLYEPHVSLRLQERRREG
jgi:hypothetical protein